MDRTGKVDDDRSFLGTYTFTPEQISAVERFMTGTRSRRAWAVLLVVTGAPATFLEHLGILMTAVIAVVTSKVLS